MRHYSQKNLGLAGKRVIGGNMRAIKSIFYITLFVMLLNGCASTVEVSGASVNYLNPDMYGQASPVVVTVYQLQNDYSFQKADYSSLANNPAAVLSSDLLEKNSFEVQPGDSFDVEQKLYPNTKFIGIMAGFRDPNSVSWHKIVQLEKPGKSISIDVTLESAGLSINQ
jgi:type VI secretion system protein VasD